MAKSYSVALYTLSVVEKKKNKKGEEEEGKKFLNLKEPIHDGKDFYFFLEKYLKKTSTTMVDDEKEETHLRVREYTKHKGKTFYTDGVIECGESGSSSKLYHTKTKAERIKFSAEADLVPFYFCLRQSNDPRCAVMCLQRLGHQGVKTQLINSIQTEFRELFPNHILTIEDHLPEFYRKRFFSNNVVKKVEYTYFTNLRDVASRLEADGDRDIQRGEAIVKLSVQPNKGYFHKFRNGLNADIRQILSEMKPKALNIDDDKLKDTSVTLSDKNGKTRTFRTSQDRDILPYLDVTDQVRKGDDGHPEFEDMRSVVTDILGHAKLIDKNG